MFASPVEAYKFTLSDTEFALWPEYCQVRYVTTIIGRRSRHAAKIPDIETRRKKWEALLGRHFMHIHHYCAGVIHLNRSIKRTTAEKLQLKFDYEKAIGDLGFSYQRATPEFFLFSQIAERYAYTHELMGEVNKAIEILTHAIQQQPAQVASYTRLSYILREAGQVDKALELLKKAEQLVTDDPKQVYVHLAHTYMDMGDLDNARKYSNLAYAKGYLLPGLKIKLKQVAKQIEEGTFKPKSEAVAAENTAATAVDAAADTAAVDGGPGAADTQVAAEPGAAATGDEADFDDSGPDAVPAPGTGATQPGRAAAVGGG